MSDIAVLVEHRLGTVRDISFEMLAAARDLAKQTGGKVQAILLGHNCSPLLEQLKGHSDVIIVAEHHLLSDYNYEVYQCVLAKLLSVRQFSVVMIGHSAFGTDLAPSLAAELGLGLVSDAAGFNWTPAGLVVTRGMYASKLCAERLIKTKPAIVMVRQSHFKPTSASLVSTIETWNPADALTRQFTTKFIAWEEIPVTGIDITKASVIVAVGRGLKDPANLPAVKELADALGGVLAGSRPVIDAGWLPKECQVGSSGRTVKPKLYLALGISGTFQHVAGMRAAETIIAVNKDPNAPIFSIAHYGIVDDMHKVVPALKAKLAEAR